MAQDPVPPVYAQTSRMHKVLAASRGDDEFSVFSVSAAGRKRAPVDVNPEQEGPARPGGGRKLLDLFRGFFGS